MNNSLWILFFAIAFYVILVDKNVALYLTLVFKIIQIQFERMIWMIHLHPYNPIQRYLIRRRSWKQAQKLMKELKDN